MEDNEKLINRIKQDYEEAKAEELRLVGDTKYYTLALYYEIKELLIDMLTYEENKEDVEEAKAVAKYCNVCNIIEAIYEEFMSSEGDNLRGLLRETISFINRTNKTIDK